MRRKLLFLMCALLLLLAVLLTARAVAARTVSVYDLSWNALTGGSPVEAGEYTLDSGIGQPVVGANSAEAYSLCAGYICGAPLQVRTYLPVVVRR